MTIARASHCLAVRRLSRHYGDLNRCPTMVKLHESWLAPLQAEFDSSYMADLRQFLVAEKAAGKRIFPPGGEWFHALDATPLDRVKIVILGQDPYHGPGQAHGLCFSVCPGVRIPPSLVNIYKEMETDLGVAPASHGHLEHWAKQGVLLLNSVLTVEAHQAASHRGRGWERFTDAVIRLVDARDQAVVFILWGSYAQKKAAFVDRSKHLVLKAPHPSPLSAHNGFFGSKPFSQANAFLEANGLEPIDWRLPEAV
ncbi:uracil-DNA glycosylase [Oceaniradius stylonematis]|uniref:Uracil-DNA glycosylase n=2 Tax=Oceaniradius stylonematis TaxID=2184161 RepID=A0A3A8A8J3_9HYPH|nr:uracil-DNA glycosylase [Oceaniradius stylonematis]